MHTFFHGWRRKAGCVTLWMAVMVFVIWMRSRVVTESIVFPILWRQQVVQIVAGRVVWSGGFGEGAPEFNRISKARAEEDILMLHTQPSSLGGRTLQWVITLREVCLSLALLSAYLILWKPRRRPPDA